MRYAFLTRTGTTNVYRIVHEGRLLPRGGGVEAMAAYLREIDAFHRDQLKESDLRDVERSTLTIDHQHAAWAEQMIKIKNEAPSSL